MQRLDVQAVDTRKSGTPTVVTAIANQDFALERLTDLISATAPGRDVVLHRTLGLIAGFCNADRVVLVWFDRKPTPRAVFLS